MNTVSLLDRLLALSIRAVGLINPKGIRHECLGKRHWNNHVVAKCRSTLKTCLNSDLDLGIFAEPWLRVVAIGIVH